MHRTIDDTRLTIRQGMQSFRTQSEIRWGLVLRESGRPVGRAGFYRLMQQHYRGELVYELARSASGHGYITEALTAIVRFGFDQLGLHSIEAGIDPGNSASIRVAERLGFRREGYLTQNYFFQGKFYDTILFTLLDQRPPRRSFSRIRSIAQRLDAVRESLRRHPDHEVA